LSRFEKLRKSIEEQVKHVEHNGEEAEGRGGDPGIDLVASERTTRGAVPGFQSTADDPQHDHGNHQRSIRNEITGRTMTLQENDNNAQNADEFGGEGEVLAGNSVHGHCGTAATMAGVDSSAPVADGPIVEMATTRGDGQVSAPPNASTGAGTRGGDDHTNTCEDMDEIGTGPNAAILDNENWHVQKFL